MRVRWGSTLSNGFNVSNGVRQGGILSPYLFSLYLDGLLEELADGGVGCFWGSLFMGAVAYADDVVLMAPCAFALRCMPNICNTYASQHGLLFNAGKTQLICLRKSKFIKSLPVIYLNTQLKYKDEVKHLGHILHYNLDDDPDITRAIKDVNKKANSVLCLFHLADPVVKTYLIKMYCLSLYGCSLWSLSSKSLNCLQITLNKILIKVWNLPLRSHSSVVHCIARVPSVMNIPHSHFDRFFSSISQLTFPIVSLIFDEVAVLPYNFLGYNNLYGENHFKIYSSFDQDISSFIRSIRVKHGTVSPFEFIITHLCCI